MSGWMTVLNVVTTIGQVMLSLSLGPDMYNIHRRQSVGEMPALSLVCTLPNTHLWYVLLSGHCNSKQYLTTNMCFQDALRISRGQHLSGWRDAGLWSACFNIVYVRWSPKHKRKELLKAYTWAFALHCAVTLYFVLVMTGVTGQTHAEASTSLGYFGLVFSVCVFASPLGTLKRVVRTKSAVSIPINMSLMIFVSSVLWVATGLLDSDYFVAGLNAAGVLLGAIQMVLYNIYRPGRGGESFPDQQYGTSGELPVVLSPIDKSAGITVFAESPAYKSLPSPVIVTSA